jgi:two-component system chemotaxis response regulator CheB
MNTLNSNYSNNKFNNIIPDSEINKIIVIGSSTGGTETLAYLIEKLPAQMPPILIVQHIPLFFSKPFAERLNNLTELTVKLAEDNELVKKNYIYLAPGDSHMEIKKFGNMIKIFLNKKNKVHFQRPAADVLFKSAAKYIGKKTVGLILTGMGSDGAQGMFEIKNAGGYTIGQDEKTSFIYGMPKAAYEIGGVCKQLPLHKIPQELVSRIR